MTDDVDIGVKIGVETCHLKKLMTALHRALYLPIFMIAAVPVGAAEAVPSRELPAEILRLWPYHASLVILGFCLLVWGMTVARRKEKGWLKKHKVLGMSGAIFAIAGMTMAAYMISAASQEHFKVPHAYLGSFVILLLILTPTLGLLQLKATKERRAHIRRVHKLFGRTALLLMALNMLFGMLIVSLA